MNRFELIQALSDETGLSVKKFEEIVIMVFNNIANALSRDERVEIRGFGSFKVKHYDGYIGRNPKTGERVKVKPKKLPFFKCGKELKDLVDIYK